MKDERYSTEDQSVAKYVHVDGSETSIKTWPEGMSSCGGSGRDKFNVFASISSGCAGNCKFCFLTTKKYSYHKLGMESVVENVVGAVLQEFVFRPHLRQTPMNLSWMGMGDAFANLNLMKEVSDKIIQRLNGEVGSFEGIDISTTLPMAPSYGGNILCDLHNNLINTGKVTSKPKNRTNVRVFYSLHSMIESKRQLLIPNTLPVNEALKYLESLSNNYFNVVYHYMFLDGVNDSDIEVEMLADYFSSSGQQLRVLRYNQCKGSKFSESFKFSKIIETLHNRLGDTKLKVQLSPGSEVAAACGMFLMSKRQECC